VLPGDCASWPLREQWDPGAACFRLVDERIKAAGTTDRKIPLGASSRRAAGMRQPENPLRLGHFLPTAARWVIRLDGHWFLGGTR
jgi:hypothetical protein